MPVLRNLDQLGDLRELPQIGTVVLGAHTQDLQLRQSSFDHFGRGEAVQGDVTA
jgi:hypothetical protein